MRRFDRIFSEATGFVPHEYQKRLACGDHGKRGKRGKHEWLSGSSSCESKLIDIPTGMGKTSAVVSAWLWNRVLQRREDWPRRMVYCLPMRTLVEQTRQNVDRWLNNLGLADSIGVHLLMGGEDDSDWDIHPERNAILIGTQDMLLSRALNRGYGMSRYRWPMHFGLLNNDCLWVMDEVQLMGPGLWTSAQLDWMRSKRFQCLKPCATWWMSATIRPEFLHTLDRRKAEMPTPTLVGLSDCHRTHAILEARRPCKVWEAPAQSSKKHTGESAVDPQEKFAESLADAVADEHRAASLSLVVCNTVAGAQRIYTAVKNRYKGPDEVALLTSRFRSEDRERNQRKILAFEAERKRAGKDGSVAVPGLICISTQVIEAGVDVSARRLWSEIAPWPSIVQRLGRLNRDGKLNGDACAYFWEGQEKPKKGARSIGPYEAEAVNLGKQLIKALADLYCSNEKFSARDALAQLRSDQNQTTDKALTPAPAPCPRAIDVHGLFSTEPDVFGGFTDVSPFVRNSDENPDVTVFWREWGKGAQLKRSEELTGPAFQRREGCSVAVGRLKDFLGEQGKAWIWDDKIEAWQPTFASEIRPGMLAMLPRTAGGYSYEMGWTGRKRDNLSDAPPPGEPREKFEQDRFSESGFWVELGDHLRDAKNEAARIIETLGLDRNIGEAVIHASSEHDIGKSLPQWQEALPEPPPHATAIWAKAPYQFAVTADSADEAEVIEAILRREGAFVCRAKPWAKENAKGQTTYRWHTGSRILGCCLEAIRAASGIRRAWNVPFRPGLRHEAATALALWHCYYRQKKRDFAALSIYLAAAHHGKVRTVLTARTDSGQDVCGIAKTTAPLPWGAMPLDFECAVDGASGHFSADGSEFVFEAPGWTGLVNDLLGGWEAGAAQFVNGAVPDGEPGNLGPFGLAYLETLVRCADERASRNPGVRKDIGQ